MIGFFIAGIVIFSIVIIVSIFLLIRMSSAETQFMEVSNRYLKDIGKSYNKDTFAMEIYNLYKEIMEGVQNERYEFLRDVLSDDIYNSYLRGIKVSKDHQVKNMVVDMKPVFSKLISMIVKGNMEIAKVWIRVSFFEYAIDTTPLTEEQKQVVKGERIVGGSKTNRLEREYILTLVKNHTPKESIACPACGHVTNVVLHNQCMRCGSSIANRRYHWVVIGKEEKPLSH